MENFEGLKLHATLAAALSQLGFNEPTPIQAQAIPPALEGRDILGSAQTGTGKTGAFGIPMVDYLLRVPTGVGLILLPTRELAVQVLKALQGFLGNSGVPMALLIGGEPMPKQLAQLRRRPRILVGTPGRVNDHLARGTLRLTDLRFLVLDETDRMLDMGFGVQLEAIAAYLPEVKPQTLLFSATLPHNIRDLAHKYLKDPVRVSIGQTNAVAQNLTQQHVRLEASEKYAHLLKELDQRAGTCLIFVKTKRAAKELAQKLRKEDHAADELHGDLRQTHRKRVIEAFRNEKCSILVATDVAARGLDIPHIAHVINYDLPQSPEDYIHRIGRTARAGAQGQALNLLTPQDGAKWRAIERLLNPQASTRSRENGGSARAPREGRAHAGGWKSGKPQPWGTQKREFTGRTNRKESLAFEGHSKSPRSHARGAESSDAAESRDAPAFKGAEDRPEGRSDAFPQQNFSRSPKKPEGYRSDSKPWAKDAGSFSSAAPKGKWGAGPGFSNSKPGFRKSFHSGGSKPFGNSKWSKPGEESPRFQKPSGGAWEGSPRSSFRPEKRWEKSSPEGKRPPAREWVDEQGYPAFEKPAFSRSTPGRGEKRGSSASGYAGGRPQSAQGSSYRPGGKSEFSPRPFGFRLTRAKPGFAGRPKFSKSGPRRAAAG